MCDGLLIIATARAGVSGRVLETLLLPHEWKGAVCHLEELETARVFQVPVDRAKGLPIDDVKFTLVRPLFFFTVRISSVVNIMPFEVPPRPRR